HQIIRHTEMNVPIIYLRVVTHQMAVHVDKPSIQCPVHETGTMIGPVWNVVKEIYATMMSLWELAVSRPVYLQSFQPQQSGFSSTNMSSQFNTSSQYDRHLLSKEMKDMPQYNFHTFPS
ncbi:unnamed protein product, partial [Owenia fusiformis]